MIEVTEFDAADYLSTKEDCIAYLQAAAEEDDTTIDLFFAMMDDIVRSDGARESLNSAGLDAAELQAALAADIYDRFDAVVKILRALGLRLCVVPIEGSAAEDQAAAEVSLPPAV